MKQLWCLGIIVNIFLFYSVFDIHFKSPIVDVQNVYAPVGLAAIRRVIFFVADGLRADSFFDHPEYRPYLTTVLGLEDVAWGISDTTVPTESRPGHVALFAGFYEDPSAVFTGWKENVVEFDSIFNRANFSVALGSPDIINMFARGSAKSRIYSEVYPSDWQDFSTANSSKLDLWVLEKFENLVKQEKLPMDQKSFIFLHLLGIDNTGHSTKPPSKEYFENILVVDNIVKRVEELVYQYYSDDQTLFIFTSDHGMTDWGSHGSGSKEETETPFVLWGQGIKGNQNIRLKQADFTAIIAGALKIPFPTNSIGRFPSGIWYTKKFTFRALQANFKQLHELMLRKKELIEAERNFALTPFEEEPSIERELQNSEVLIKSKHFEYAADRLIMGLDYLYDGIKYYERYNERLLLFFSVFTFISFIALIGFSIVNFESQETVNLFQKSIALYSFIISFIISKGFIGWSLRRLPYTFVPVYLISILIESIKERKGPRSIIGVKNFFILCFFAFIGIEILVKSFYERTILTFGTMINAIWFVKGKNVGSWQGILSLGSFAIISLFPMAPVIGGSQNLIFTTSGPFISFFIVMLLLQKCPFISKKDATILLIQGFLLLCVPILLHFPSSLITRIVSWSSVFLSVTIPVLTSSTFLAIRLLSIFLSISLPFSLLSLSHESLFFPSLFFALISFLKAEVSEENGLRTFEDWEEFLSLRIETRDRNTGRGQDLQRAFKRAWFHLFFVFLSFFGTGNIASVSSFDPSAVRCFVSIFNPFVMMMLLLVKIVGPFLLVSCFFRSLLWSKMQVERNFLIVLFLCEGMSLHTFFMVQNKGSWLEIGTSISHFVIVQCTTLFLLLLYFCANFLISARLFPDPHLHFTTEKKPLVSHYKNT